MMLSKLQRRGLAFLLAFAMTFSLMPVTGFATEEETEPVTVETTVPETEPAVMETTVPETEPVVETTATTEAVTEPTVETEAETEPDEVFKIEPVTETVLVDNSVVETQTEPLAEIRGEIAEYNTHYGLTPDMTDEELANVYFSIDESEPLVLTWSEEIIAMAEELTEAEIESLIAEEEANVFFRFCNVVNSINTPAPIAKTVTPLEGQVSVTDSEGNGSLSNGTVTITAKGGLLSQTTNTVTITNESSSSATIAFNYSASNYKTFSEPTDSGEYSTQLAPGDTCTLSITGKRALSSNTATLTLSNFTYTAAAATCAVKFQYDSAVGSITVAGETAADGSSHDISSSTGAALVATPNSGTTFFGWVDKDGKVLSTSANYTFVPAMDMTIKAIFAGGTTPVAIFQVGSNYLFDDLSKATACATATGNTKIVLLNNGTLPAGDYTIPAGVTLLIPFDSAHTLYTTKPTSTGTTYTKPTLYRKLTMADGANITVNGAMSLSAKYKSGSGGSQNTGAPSGPYSMIQMNEGSTITVSDSAALYAWGFITGSGRITAKSGAKVYEYFQFQDWRGGDQTTNSNMKSHGVFPISQYYIQNIEVPLVLEAGAKEYAFTSVSVTLLGEQTASAPFVSTDGAGAMFEIKSGSLTKWYDGSTDRQHFELNGEVNLNYVKLEMGIYSVSSANFNLAINNNITVHVKSGSTINILNNTALLPGTEIIIEEGASCTLAEGKNLYIYDLDEWGTYCGAGNAKLLPITYAPGKTYTRSEADLKDCKIQIAGTADASAGCVYTTAGGADICGVEGGSIKVNPGSSTVTYQVIQAGDSDNSTYPEIPITAAKLQNGDGSYAITANSTDSDTYTYTNGKWICVNTHTDVAGVIVAPTCTTEGYTPYTCSVCGETQNSDFVAALGHQYENGLCSCGKGVKFTIKHNLGLADLVQIGYWIQVESVDTEVTDYGLLIWDEDAYAAETDYTVTSSTAYQPELTARMGYQQGYGEGIFAQFLDTKYYAVPYVVTADGSTLYGDVDVYSVPDYAGQMSSQTEIVQQTVYDLLNYGTYAQAYFVSRNGGDVNGLTAINSVSPSDKRENRYEDSMKVDALTGYKDTDKSLACNWLYTTAELESAIALNYFAEESETFTGMLYWNETDYTDASSLVYNTKTTVVPVENRSIYGSDTTTGQIDSIYAKNIFDWQYACMYNLTEETYTYGPLRVDSVAAYLTRMIDTYSSSAEVTDTYLVNTCKAMLAYGDSARTYAGK